MSVGVQQKMLMMILVVIILRFCSLLSLSLIKLLTYLPTKRVKIKPAEIMINIEYD
jgi:hypothetical protein